ncbi:hypothetical protein SLEP1_g42684 [Rubroshorea leprosula]|uniref:Uncharacterized protein n=1 Tax=Rubroshorea leprosula TaxID=152421 RepID=A0AAV5LAW2_9ROSI|nr:hypothetical protein SLEP1_g42684 [Rubroshorea leprosula]
MFFVESSHVHLHIFFVRIAWSRHILRSKEGVISQIILAKVRLCLTASCMSS